MTGRSHILRHKDGLFAVCILAAAVFGLWLGTVTLGRETVSSLPIPGVVSAVSFAIFISLGRRRLEARLTLSNFAELGERVCAVEGVIRRLHNLFVSPYSNAQCVAWRGWFGSAGDFDDDEFSKAVPFVLESSRGEAVVVHLSDESGRVPRAWDHLGHGEIVVQGPADREVNWDDARHVERFLENVLRRGRPLPTRRPDCELSYSEGETVVLGGRFHRSDDSLGFAAMRGIPTYEVTGAVVFAKGPRAFHLGILAPWVRSQWPWYLAAGMFLELLVQFGLAIGSASGAV